MTAAKAAAVSSVNLPASRPMTGAARIPDKPARNSATTQTPAAMRDGSLPDNDVIASESTMARTLKPASVNRSTSAPSTTIASTHAYVITWFSVTTVPKNGYTWTGSGARPGVKKISTCPKMMLLIWGTATNSPMVTTTLMSCDDSRRKRKIPR